MIEQQGRVVLERANEAGVQIGASPGCPACEAGQGCGAGIFSQLLRREPVILLVRNTIGARTGQMVTLGIPEKIFLRVLFSLYLLPLISALAGAAAGYHLANRLQASTGIVDGITLLGAVLAFGLALFLRRNSNPELPDQLKIQLLRTGLEPSGRNDCPSDRTILKY